MRVPLNKWGWQIEAKKNWDKIYELLGEYVEIDAESRTISVDPIICPVPGNFIYNYLQDTFDEPRMMQYPIPITAQTLIAYTLINEWQLGQKNRMAGMYFLPEGPIGTTIWDECSSERSNRYSFEYQVPRVFVGDYILHKETSVEPVGKSISIYR